MTQGAGGGTGRGCPGLFLPPDSQPLHVARLGFLGAWWPQGCHTSLEVASSMRRRQALTIFLKIGPRTDIQHFSGLCCSKLSHSISDLRRGEIGSISQMEKYKEFAAIFTAPQILRLFPNTGEEAKASEGATH